MGNMFSESTVLNLSWSVSKGFETYGYNICRLDDMIQGKRYRTIGGGYDMVGAVLGEWIQDNFKDELIHLAKSKQAENLYGLCTIYNKDGELYKVLIDGASGESSMISIIEALGMNVKTLTSKHRSKGYVRTGFYITKGN